MNRYHVNPTTGNPSLCRADDPANCPFGTHTLNAVECFDIYGRVMADHVIPKPWSRKGPRTRPRDVSIEQWEASIKQREALFQQRQVLFKQWKNPAAGRKGRALELGA